MADFLVILANPRYSGRAGLLFESGLQIAGRASGREPLSRTCSNGTWAATFPRHNGSGVPIALDAQSGTWLLASGTWFHESGLGPGHEPALLDRLNQIGADRLAGEMEGFFVLVSGNYATAATCVLTDIIGSCHCFIRTWPEISAVSASSLLLASLDTHSLDPVACQEFLSTGVIYEDRTVHQDVRKLEAGSTFRFQQGRLECSRRYWKPSHISPNSLKGGAAVEELAGYLVAAAQKIGSRFPRIACDLTGGYDSRALVAGMLHGKQRFSTAVSGLPSSPDVQISQHLAVKMGLPHIHMDSRPAESLAALQKALEVTDGECDLVEYSKVLEIHSALSKDFDISLNGSFGEVGRGYWWELLIPRTGKLKPLDAGRLARLRYAVDSYREDLFPAHSRIHLVDHLKEVIGRTNDGLSGLPNTLQMDHIYLMMRMQRWQGRIASSTNRIWPCLSPFMFRPVLEAMLRTDFRMRRRSLLMRLLLVHLNPELASYPLEHGYPAIPFTLRSAHRFWPIVPLYAGKAARKLASHVGVRRPRRAPFVAEPARLRLWHDEGIAKILEPRDMALATVLNAAALEEFIARSREADFQYDAQWSRLLSLELTLRAVKDAAEVQQERSRGKEHGSTCES